MSILSSVRWVAVSQAARVLSQLISITVLARILPTHAYGQMAMAMTITNLVFLFRDLGTTTAVIQHRQLTHSLTCTAHWLNVSVSLALALLLGLSAYPLAWAFNEAALCEIILVLSVVFPISGLTLVRQALLERQSEFATLARIEIVSALGGVVGAVSLALAGAGIWSLVGQMLLSTLLTTGQLFRASSWRSSILFSKDDLKILINSGTNLSLFRLIIYLEQNIDSLVIGKFLGSGALGIYAMAYKIMLFPIQNLTAVVSRALLPELSRRQDMNDSVGILYTRSLRIICAIAAPLMGGVFFLRQEFVELVFGPRWTQVSQLLTWLAPVGFIQAITAGTGVVFIAVGRTRLMLRLGMLGGALQISAFLVGVNWGIEGVAACYFVANLINFFPCFIFASIVLNLPIARTFLNLLGPILATSLMLLSLSLIEATITQYLSNQYIAFLAVAAAGASVYFVSLIVLLPQDFARFCIHFRLKIMGTRFQQ